MNISFGKGQHVIHRFAPPPTQFVDCVSGKLLLTRAHTNLNRLAFFANASKNKSKCLQNGIKIDEQMVPRALP